MAHRETGMVKWFNNRRGYGFIERGEEDVFVHYREIQGDGFRTLKEGEQVEYEVSESERGLKAENVVKLNEGSASITPSDDASVDNLGAVEHTEGDVQTE